MRPAGIVVAVDGKRYTVFLQEFPGGARRPTRVSVWMSGAFNRAGHWRSIDPWGRPGKAAVAAAIAADDAEPAK